MHFGCLCMFTKVTLDCDRLRIWHGYEATETYCIIANSVIVSFGTIYAPNIAITYVAECHPKLTAECLVSINVFKNLVAFLFLYTAVDWVASSGWVQVYMIMFMLVSLSMLAAVPLYFFGSKE